MREKKSVAAEERERERKRKKKEKRQQTWKKSVTVLFFPFSPASQRFILGGVYTLK